MAEFNTGEHLQIPRLPAHAQEKIAKLRSNVESKDPKHQDERGTNLVQGARILFSYDNNKDAREWAQTLIDRLDPEKNPKLIDPTTDEPKELYIKRYGGKNLANAHAILAAISAEEQLARPLPDFTEMNAHLAKWDEVQATHPGPKIDQYTAWLFRTASPEDVTLGLEEFAGKDISTLEGIDLYRYRLLTVAHKYHQRISERPVETERRILQNAEQRLQAVFGSNRTLSPEEQLYLLKKKGTPEDLIRISNKVREVRGSDGILTPREWYELTHGRYVHPTIKEGIVDSHGRIPVDLDDYLNSLPKEPSSSALTTTDAQNSFAAYAAEHFGIKGNMAREMFNTLMDWVQNSPRTDVDPNNTPLRQHLADIYNNLIAQRQEGTPPSASEVTNIVNLLTCFVIDQRTEVKKIPDEELGDYYRALFTCYEQLTPFLEEQSPHADSLDPKTTQFLQQINERLQLPEDRLHEMFITMTNWFDTQQTKAKHDQEKETHPQGKAQDQKEDSAPTSPPTIEVEKTTLEEWTGQLKTLSQDAISKDMYKTTFSRLLGLFEDRLKEELQTDEIPHLIEKQLNEEQRRLLDILTRFTIDAPRALRPIPGTANHDKPYQALFPLYEHMISLRDQAWDRTQLYSVPQESTKRYAEYDTTSKIPPEIVDILIASHCSSSEQGRELLAEKFGIEEFPQGEIYLSLDEEKDAQDNKHLNILVGGAIKKQPDTDKLAFEAFKIAIGDIKSIGKKTARTTIAETLLLLLLRGGTQADNILKRLLLRSRPEKTRHDEELPDFNIIQPANPEKHIKVTKERSIIGRQTAPAKLRDTVVSKLEQIQAAAPVSPAVGGHPDNTTPADVKTDKTGKPELVGAGV